jgi:hypothetical protein
LGDDHRHQHASRIALAVGQEELPEIGDWLQRIA